MSAAESYPSISTARTGPIEDLESLQNRVVRLTKRQKDCLRLVAQNYTSKEIGLRLGISFSTVDNHLQNAVQILGAANRAEAARALVLHELPPRQQLPRQPETLVPALNPLEDRRQEAEGWPGRLGKLLPPIGGRPNDLPTAQRVYAIARIALFSTLVFVTCVIVIRTCFDALR